MVSLKANKGKEDEEHIGDIVLKINVHKATSKNLTIADIKVKLV